METRLDNVLMRLEQLYATSEKIDYNNKAYKVVREFILEMQDKEKLRELIIDNLNKELGDGFMWVYKHNSFMNLKLKIHIFLGNQQMVVPQLLMFKWSHNEFSWEKKITTDMLSLQSLTYLIDYFKEWLNGLNKRDTIKTINVR